MPMGCASQMGSRESNGVRPYTATLLVPPARDTAIRIAASGADARFDRAGAIAVKCAILDRCAAHPPYGQHDRP